MKAIYCRFVRRDTLYRAAVTSVFVLIAAVAGNAVVLDPPLSAEPDMPENGTLLPTISAEEEQAALARTYFDFGLRAEGAGKSEEAGRWFDRLLVIVPSPDSGKSVAVAEVYTLQGAVYAKRAQWNKAIEKFRFAAGNTSDPARQNELAKMMERCRAESKRPVPSAADTGGEIESATQAIAQGRFTEAAAIYRNIAARERDTVNRGRWILRAARASVAAGDFASAQKILNTFPSSGTASEDARARRQLSDALMQTASAPTKSAPLRLSSALPQMMAQMDAESQDSDALLSDAIKEVALHADDRTKLAREIEQAIEEARLSEEAATAFDRKAVVLDDGTNAGRLAASVARLDATRQRNKAKKTKEKASALREQAKSLGYGEPGYEP